jgi:trimethylamine:corrinoid methyltransferase-like protein
MLDMEIRKAEWSYSSEIPVDDESLDWEEVLRITAQGGNFLESEHTLRHCRELWLSELFRSDSPFEGAWDGTEKAILDRCDELWRERLKEYRPPVWPKEKMQALDQLLARARAELGVG